MFGESGCPNIFFSVRMLSAALKYLSVLGLVSGLPQLPIPANNVRPSSVIRPSGVRGEVSRISLVEDTRDNGDTLSSPADLLNVLNNRIVTTDNRVQTATLPGRTQTRTRIFTNR